MSSRVDFVTLGLFVAVCEERSLARAAERVHLAASAISKRLADLEQTLNVRLFERKPTGMYPTTAGTALLHHARLVLRNVAELEARRALLKNDVDRVSGLYKLNAATKTALDQAITALREYDARIEARKQKMADLVLRAPIDGVVLKREGHIGDMAGTGVNDALFWVGKPKPLRIDADVNEEDMPRVKVGQKVLLRHDGFPGQALEAAVDDITPKGDPQTKTFRVYLALPNETPLRIGMSVEANIVIAARENALVVPAEAIFNGAVDRVADGVVARTPVKTGVRGVRLVEVLAGLDEGARVISPARRDLKDGARVRASGP